MCSLSCSWELTGKQILRTQDISGLRHFSTTAMVLQCTICSVPLCPVDSNDFNGNRQQPEVNGFKCSRSYGAFCAATLVELVSCGRTTVPVPSEDSSWYSPTLLRITAHGLHTIRAIKR